MTEKASNPEVDLESGNNNNNVISNPTSSPTEGVRSRLTNPLRKTTIQLEEGQTLDEKTNGNNSGSLNAANASSSDLSNGNGNGRRRISRDQSDSRTGLGGNGLVPRRATLDSNPGGRDLRRSFTSLFQPEKRLKPAPSNYQCFKNIIFYNWINLALLLIPVSWALHFAAEDKYVAIFITAFIAIIPLAQLLSYGTEEIALRVGQTVGGLLNASLGNAVELIVAIIALFQCEYTIVQTSLVGSVLSNILLVLGTCFFVGGLRFKEQEFKQTAAQLNTSLLAMAVISALIPAGFHATLGEDIRDDTERSDILKMSHGVSVLLLIIYGGYLYFTLSSHKHLYDDEDAEEEQPTLNVPMAIGLLVVSTVLVGVTSEWLVDAIDPFAAQYDISKTWIGLILLPIASNAAEHVTAVVASYKNKVDLAMGVAVGSSIQISLFVLPLLVIIAWIANKPLSLLFDPFVAIMLFLAVLIVNYALADGRANYMEGWLLIQVYLIAALVFWFVHPNADSDLFLDGCHVQYPVPT